jgi:hypothetical protein
VGDGQWGAAASLFFLRGRHWHHAALDDIRRARAQATTVDLAGIVKLKEMLTKYEEILKLMQ